MKTISKVESGLREERERLLGLVQLEKDESILAPVGVPV